MKTVKQSRGVALSFVCCFWFAGMVAAQPTVTNVTSNAGNSPTTYTHGQSITITVAFSEPVLVTCPASTVLTLETGNFNRNATYASGSGTLVLSFTYAIQIGDFSSDLNYVATNSLSGCITSLLSVSANLTLPGLTSAGSLGVNKNIVIQDSTTPSITSVSSTTANATYGTCSVITLTVDFDEPVYVTGSPRLQLETGTTDQFAVYSSGSGSAAGTLNFSYTVQAGDASADLNYLNTAALTLNGGTIRDGVSKNAILTLPAIGAAGSLAVNKNIVVNGTVPSAPTTQASFLNFSSFQTNSLFLSWTNGNGMQRLVVARAGLAVDANPANGTLYAANAVFGSGDEIGTGNYVVYNGSGNGVNVTGLATNSVYHFKVYEYNGPCNGLQVYQTSETSGNPNSRTTLATQPNGASGLTTSNVTGSSLTLAWNKNGGASSLVVAIESDLPSSSVTDGETYTANPIMESGDNVNGGYVVYNGTGTSVNITNLRPQTGYDFFVFEYNGTGGAENYTGGQMRSQSTNSSPSTRIFVSSSFPIHPLISSTDDTEGEDRRVFAFDFYRGNSTSSEIQKISFFAGPQNEIDWSQSIAGANLTCESCGGGCGSGITAQIISAGAIEFINNGSCSSFWDPSFNDRTYVLRIFLKSSLTGGASQTIDGSKFQFMLNYTSFQPMMIDPTDQPIYSSVEADVVATKLAFVQQPVAVYKGVNIQPAVTVQATDINGNRDLDFVGTVTLKANTVALASTPSAIFVAGLGTFPSVNFTNTGTGVNLGTLNTAALTDIASAAFNISEPSANSDLDDDVSFTYPQNIVYTNYQESANLTTANSLEVARFMVRDGGTSNDADYAPTILTSVTLSVSNGSLIRRLALYEGPTELAETTVTSGNLAIFSGLNLTVGDFSSKTLSLLATFASTVTDNQQVSFTVTSASVATGSSTFINDLSAAQSSVAGDNNKIEVTASKLIFITQPPAIVRANANLAVRPRVEARDNNNNTDLDYNAAVATSNVQSLTMVNPPLAANWSGGILTFPVNFQYSTSNTTNPNGTLTVASDPLTSATSSALYVDGIRPSVVLSDDQTDAIVRQGEAITITATLTDDDQISESTVPHISIGTVLANMAMTKVSNLQWSFLWDVPAASDGSHTISIQATDRAGNISNVATGKTATIIDNTKPVVTLSDDETDNVVRQGNSVMITATISEANGINEATPPKISIGGIVSNVSMSKVNNLKWTYVWAVPALNDGQVQVSIATTDLAGNANAGSTGETTFIVDNTNPAVVLSDDHADNVAGDNETITITATLADASSIDESVSPKITIGTLVANSPMIKVTNTEWTYSWNVPAGENGPVTVTVAAQDITGNVSDPATGQTSYTLDAIKPTVVLDDDHEGNSVREGDPVSITATFSDLHPISESTAPVISIGTLISNQTMSRKSNAQWTYLWTPSGNENAMVSVTGFDIAGNPNATATGKIGYIVDNTPPEVVLTTTEPDLIVREGESVTFTATFTEMNEITEVTVPSISLSGTTVVNAPMTRVDNLTWQYMWAVPAGDLNSTVTILAADKAGNANNPASGQISWTIDNRRVQLGEPNAFDQTFFTANWNAVEDATMYAVDVSADNFSTFILADEQTTATSLKVEGLSAGTTYQYRVRFFKEASVSATSLPMAALTVPPTPVLSDAGDVQPTSFVLHWGASQSSTEYFVDVSKDNFSSAPASLTNIPVSTGTSLQVTGLSAGTNYRYRVRAKNASGTSPSSVAGEQVTVPPQPGPPAIPPGNRTPSGFFVQWSAVQGATDYFIDVLDVTTTPGIYVPGYENKPVPGTFITVSGLNPGTNYSVILRASNDGGTSEDSEAVFTQTLIEGGGELTDTPTLQIVFDESDRTIDVTVLDGQKPFALTFLHRKISDAQDLQPESTILLENITTYHLDVPEAMLDEIGMDFQFHVVDKISREAQSLLTSLYRQQETTNIPNLTSGGKLKDYVMFSVPYELEDNSIQSIFEPALGKYDKTRWRLIRYQDGRNVDYTEGLNKIEIGKGYWLNTAVPVTIDVGSGSIPAVNQLKPHVISLEEGWTQIGNPYSFTIDWDAVLAAPENAAVAARIDPELLVFDQSTTNFKTTDRLESWKGAFAFSDGALELRIPVTAKVLAGGRKRSGGIAERKLDEPEWFVPISVMQGETSVDYNGFGMHPQAADSKDNYDQMVPPRFVKYLELYSYHPDYVYPWFRSDIVRTARAYTWNFNVESNFDGDRIELRWNNLAFGQNSAVLMLYDETSQVLTDMKTTNYYNFDSFSKRPLKIFYSSDKDTFHPDIDALVQAFPNPFKEGTTIPFLVSKNDTPVAIHVFNLMGQKVISLERKHYSSGYHELYWNGKDIQGNGLPAGHYYIKMETNGVLKGFSRILKVN